MRCAFGNNRTQDGEIEWDRLEELRTAVGKDRCKTACTLDMEDLVVSCGGVGCY